MGKKVYNTQDWEVNCYYTNVKNNTAAEISVDCISYIKIINTLENYIPTIYIKFIDKGYVLLNNLNTSRNVY